MVYIKTRKGTYGLTREEFQRYIYAIWERAQTRKLVQQEIKQEKKAKKKG